MRIIFVACFILRADPYGYKKDYMNRQKKDQMEENMEMLPCTRFSQLEFKEQMVADMLEFLGLGF